MGWVTIIGLGSIGKSLGLALRQSKIANLDIVGCDRSRDAAMTAKRAGAVTKIERYLPAAVEKADFVFIATPVSQVREIMGHIAEFLPSGCTVTDTANTKTEVLQWAEDILPEDVNFIGGHPLVKRTQEPGKEFHAALFQERTYCLVPGRGTSPEAITNMTQLVKLIGATPLFIDVTEHDAFVAGAELLPVILACALMSVTGRSPQWNEIANFVGDQFQSMVGITADTLEQKVEACLTNLPGIGRWLDEYMEELQKIRNLMAGGTDALRKTLLGGFQAEADRKEAGPSASSAIPSMKERMTTLFVGDGLLRRARRAEGPRREKPGKDGKP